METEIITIGILEYEAFKEAEIKLRILEVMLDEEKTKYVTVDDVRAILKA